MVDAKKLTDLILESLEHEKGGVQVYQAAVEVAVNEELREELEKYLEQTKRHVEILERVCEAMAIDIAQETPGRSIVRDMGACLVSSIRKAQSAGDPAAAQLVACECVVLAETKDHLDWELLGKCANKLEGEESKSLMEAYEEVEEEEDEHLYHSKGWCRELWVEALGMKAVLPPPEERKEVTTAIGASRAQQASEKRR